MRALFCVLAVTAVINLTLAEVEEDIESDGISSSLSNFLKTPYFMESTELINNKRFEEMTFEKEDKAPPRLLNLHITSEPFPADGPSHETCGNDFGIQINGKEEVSTFCKIVGIGFNDYNTQERSPVISLMVSFIADETRTMTVHVPIFKIPEKFVSDQDGLKAWAESNQVGIDAPFDLQQVTIFKDTNELTMDFGWLEPLVEFGTHFLPGKDSCAPQAFTRPVLIDRDAYDTLYDVYFERRTNYPPAAQRSLMSKIGEGLIAVCAPMYSKQF